MSVLSFPRLYFTGRMQWEPCTANNNDYLPTYDSANAQLDWDFLAAFGVTPDNFRETFRPWVVKPTTDSCPSLDPPQTTVDNCGDSPTCHMASRWGYYGSGACEFHQFKDDRTVAVGGDLAFGEPTAQDDPILGQPMLLSGNTFGGRASAARLVDVNPGSPWSSQIFFSGIQAGTGGAFIGGPGVEKMYSRSFYAPRNISSDLIIAGAVGVVFQTTVAREDVVSDNSAGSALIAALLEALEADDAAGLMLRFAAYNTLYYQNGVLNDFPPAKNCDELTKLYQQGLAVRNPAYSLVTGTLGVWKQGELVNAPGGRFVVPAATVTPVTPPAPAAGLRRFGKMVMAGHDGPKAHPEDAAAAASGPPPLAFGNVWGELQPDGRVISLDLSNAIPEFTVDGQKFDYGPLTVVAQLPNGRILGLAVVPFSAYDRAAYAARGGIVDVAIGTGLDGEARAQARANAREVLAEAGGLLGLMARGNVVSLERALTAETDLRGVYLDECQVAEIPVVVRYRGGQPFPAGRQVRLRLAQYYPWPLKVSSGSWQLYGSTPATSQETGAGDQPVCSQVPTSPYLRFLDGDDVPVTITQGTGGRQGQATVRIAPVSPGFPNVAFFPYFADEAPPRPPAAMNFGYSASTPYSIDDVGFASVRVMPFDNALVQEFVDRWNGTGPYAGEPKYDRTLTWLFVYHKVLYVYDMLFPVMDEFMPLGNLTRVEGAIDQLVRMITEEMEQASTLYMPVTRDLSAGKRLILETWGNLVIRKYPPQALPPLSVTCDPDARGKWP